MDVDTAAPNRSTFFVNHKIYDYNNHTIGIIGVGLASNIIRQRINAYQELFGRTIYFVNKHGEVTLHGINFPKKMSLHQMKGMHAISEQFTNNPIGSFKYNNGEHEVFVNTRLVNELGWYIVIEETNTEQPEMLRALWLNLLLSLVVTLAIGWLIHHLIQRHQTQLRLLLTNDHLTGLATRQGFEPIFHQMLKTAQRNKTSLSILLIDLDHFKKINDRMGHLEGDEALKSVARILEKNVRKCDAVSRWGGEEFIIALADCNAQSAVSLAEKIRKQIASEISTKDNDKKITASIGVAEFNLVEQSDALFARADEALYQAKKNGRNQVVSSADEIKS